MGCKGPQAFANCATVRYDEGTSWPVQAGHGCIACTMPGFWDEMAPAYGRLPSWLPFNPDVSVDSTGMVLVGGVAAIAVGHGAASIVRARRRAASERRHAGALAAAAVGAVPGASLTIDGGTGPITEPTPMPEPAPAPAPEPAPALEASSESVAAAAAPDEPPAAPEALFDAPVDAPVDAQPGDPLP
jgi:hypothetical protein